MRNFRKLITLKYMMSSCMIFLQTETTAFQSKISLDDEKVISELKLIPIKEWFKKISNPLYKCNQAPQRPHVQGRYFIKKKYSMILFWFNGYYRLRQITSYVL